MPNVLLLTAGYGEGHNAAARGLQAALTQAGACAKTFDLFALTGGKSYELTRAGYLGLINRAPRLWAAFYGLIDRVPIVPLTLPFLGKMRRRLEQIIAEEKPDALVSVYPVYGYLLSTIHPDPATRTFRFHTVVTDSITINSIWHRCDSDTFLVPNEETAVIMRAAGVPATKLRMLGFPVHPRFASNRPVRPPAGTGEPGKILYMINAGKAAAPAIVERLLRIKNTQLTVTVGRDESLRRQLEQVAQRLGKPLEIHGWTDQMPELLMSHHLLIGKAGGASVQETIAARTPMLMTQVVPGQEEGNARLLIENGCGAVCSTAEALGAKVEQLFAGDAAGWRSWEVNIARLSQPDSAARIAEFVLGQK